MHSALFIGLNLIFGAMLIAVCMKIFFGIREVLRDKRLNVTSDEEETYYYYPGDKAQLIRHFSEATIVAIGLMGLMFFLNGGIKIFS